MDWKDARIVLSVRAYNNKRKTAFFSYTAISCSVCVSFNLPSNDEVIPAGNIAGNELQSEDIE